MPCFLFTWHTYGSWLPDRPQGYVHWKRGLQKSSVVLAQCYRSEQRQPEAHLTSGLQKCLIEELAEASTPVKFRLHFVATDKFHVHALVSWKDSRYPKQLRRSLRRSMTIRLNDHERRKWFSRGGNTKRLKRQDHFDYLINAYLASHRGWKWCENRGMFR